MKGYDNIQIITMLYHKNIITFKEAPQQKKLHIN